MNSFSRSRSGLFRKYLAVSIIPCSVIFAADAPRSSLSSGGTGTLAGGTLHSSIGQPYLPQTFVLNGTSLNSSGFLAAPIFTPSASLNLPASAVYGTAPTAVPSGAISSDANVAQIIAENGASKVRYAGVGTAEISVVSPQLYLTRSVNSKAPVQVTPAELTITADNKKKETGAQDPELTVTYTGFVNGDDQTALTAKPVVSRLAGEESGSYPISVTGASAKNYSIKTADGLFVIGTTEITVNPGEESMTLPLYTFIPVDNIVNRSEQGNVEFLVAAPQGSSVKILIADAVGHTLDNQSVPAEYTSASVRKFSWDMKNIHGEMVASGAYLAVAQITEPNGTVTVRKCMIGIKE